MGQGEGPAAVAAVVRRAEVLCLAGGEKGVLEGVEGVFIVHFGGALPERSQDGRATGAFLLPVGAEMAQEVLVVPYFIIADVQGELA